MKDKQQTGGNTSNTRRWCDSNTYKDVICWIKHVKQQDSSNKKQHSTPTRMLHHMNSLSWLIRHRPFTDEQENSNKPCRDITAYWLDKNLCPQNPCSVDATGRTHLYKDLPPIVARLEKTPRSVMFSGHDWMLRKPAGLKDVQQHY